MKKEKKNIPGERLFVAFLACFSLAVLILAYGISGFSSASSPGAFPMFSSAVMLISILFVVGDTLARKVAGAENTADEIRQAVSKTIPLEFVVYLGLIILYLVLIKPLTFIPASFCFLVSAIFFLKGSRLVKAVLISGASIGIIYLVFHYLFRVVLPCKGK